MSFFEELKRRNVIRVAIAYVVGAWLLVQGADLIFGLVGAEDWLLRALAGLLALGFIPAVIFAWAFEITPEGIKKEKEVDRTRSITHHTAKKLDIATMVLVVGAVVLLAVDRMLPQQGAGSDAADSIAAAQADIAGMAPAHPCAPPSKCIPAQKSSIPQEVSGQVDPEANQKSIAVLPFANRSNQNDDLFFTDGIHDDLLTQLAKIGELTVISRTSVMEYRDTSKNLKEIGAELNVSTILEGGVQKVGDRVRVTAQLIEVATDKHLWAESFDRELTAENIFELQSEIARSIVSAISIQLTPEEEQLLADIPTKNLAAYEAYLQARELFYGANYSRSQEASAQPLLEKAIALDPDYTEAHALLANIYGQVYWRGIDTSDEFLSKYRASLARAIASNPDSPSALRAQANYHYRVESDYQRSLELLQQAQAVAPGNVDIYGDLGFTLRRLGRWEESIASFQKALQLDPANRFYYSTKLETLGSVRQWQAIIDQTVPLADADPDDLDVQLNRAWAQLELTGDLQAMKAAFQRMNLVGSSQYVGFSANVHLMLRDADAAIAVLEGPIWTGLVEQDLNINAYLEQSATASRLKGDTASATRFYEQLVARTGLEKTLGLQNRFYERLSIAHALARLGRFDEANAMIEQAETDVPEGRDALLWSSLLARRAMVRALSGDEAGAIADLEIALEIPGDFPTTSWSLHYNPDWDFFRHNELFNELASPDGLIQEKSENGL